LLLNIFLIGIISFKARSNFSLISSSMELSPFTTGIDTYCFLEPSKNVSQDTIDCIKLSENENIRLRFAADAS
jgi:hypothetical protein